MIDTLRSTVDSPPDSVELQSAVKAAHDEMMDLCAADPSATLGFASTGILKWEDIR